MSALTVSRKKVLVCLSLFALLCLLGLVGYLLFLLDSPRSGPARIGIALSPTPANLRFVKGLRGILAKQGYSKSANPRFLIRGYNDAAGARRALSRFRRSGVAMLVIAGDDSIIDLARTGGSQPVVLGFADNPVRGPVQRRIETAEMITGVSYFPPYERTLELSRRVIGDYAELTVLLAAEEPWPDLDRFQTAARKLGIAVRPVRTSLAGVSRTIAGLRGKTALLYLPAQSLWIANRRLIGSALENAGLPAVGNNLAFRDLAVLTDYAEPETMGEIAGQIIIKIQHGAIPRYMPAELSADYKLAVNLRLLSRCGLPIHEDVLSYANEVIR
ncbi:ABC-type uncharacterized transport system substrate-binding protein [Hydrogenispora ethanolica]|uniref:ABC-type uncharacterized transport system substrate-binding protein n=1 Tax=Hydrogenispora ethanolica TaxID=1082276 RepID=A0A4R1QZB7_HYDET|nr:ABC-type uncharacterized transport system substrate-binding protein [Hydrogenispora ethanolica]